MSGIGRNWSEARITVTCDYTVTPAEFSFIWEGKPWKVMSVADELHSLSDWQDLVAKMPWKVKKIYYDPQRKIHYYVRSEGLLFVSWWLHLAQLKWYDVLWWLVKHIFLFGYKHDLAYTRLGCVPSWRDFYFLANLEKLIKR